jgi:starch-binding outer membrane protein, SusD/RagB family
LANCGTDEFSAGEQPRVGNGLDVLTLCNYSLDPAHGSIQTPWNRSFPVINLANGLVKWAPDIPLTDAQRNNYLGQVRFIRGLLYLNLIQQFGAVPLDLGSGDLQFNDQPFQGFNRKDTAALLAKNYQTIIDDFIFASANLPDQRASGAFRLQKSTAFHFLAKVYLQRGYSSAKKADDFANAYTAAMEVINNLGKYNTALQTTFANIFAPGNDYNSEILFSVERIVGNFIANEVADPTGIGGNTKGVDAANFFCNDYTSVRSPLNTSGTQPVSTRTVQYGRPIRRVAPSAYTVNTAFADKFNDSRFEGSFRTVYISSTTGGGFTSGVDTGFVLALTNRIADSLNGVLPAGPRLKPYRVIAPREFYLSGGSIDPTLTRNMAPNLSKYEDPGKIQANNQGSRPFIVARLGETYLLAAEAALANGNTTQAMNLINVLKLRAANRTGLSSAQVQANYDAIKITNAATITLDYILDERTRELIGEGSRWADLATRGKLVERVTLYNADGAPRVKAFHRLRPIPISQLNNTVGENTAQYQNAGY